MRPVPFWFLDLCRPGIWAAARALFRIRFEGAEHVPLAGPVLLTPNHVSFMDPVLLTIPIRRPLHYMALEPFFQKPLLGPLMRWCRAFPIQEGEANTAAFRGVIRLLRAGEALVVFPEGGRSPDGGLQHFYPGAFRFALATGTPVVPVTIDGGFEAWPLQRRLPRPHPIRITYHPPVTAADLPPATDRKAAPAAFAALVRKTVASAVTRV